MVVLFPDRSLWTKPASTTYPDRELVDQTPNAGPEQDIDIDPCIGAPAAALLFGRNRNRSPRQSAEQSRADVFGKGPAASGERVVLAGLPVCQELRPDLGLRHVLSKSLCNVGLAFFFFWLQ